MRTPRLVSSFVLLLAATTLSAWGQVFTGSVAGTVKDPSGSVVPNAKVTLIDTGKGFTYTGNTDASGLFTVRNLPPGTYTERVEVAGFTPYERPNIKLDVAANLNTDVSLSVAAAGQTVTVSESSTPMLQTEDAATGQTINRQFINDLPLLGRQVYDLAYLAPGVSQPIGSSAGNGGGIGNNFVSDGSRNGQSDILIDGISSTTYEQNTGFVTPLYTPSVEAVEEFKVQQSNFSAEIGFSGGTVVNVVTRSGTNQVHGSLYEFLRNTDFNANSFFNNLNGVPRTSYHENDFGGTVGGPIKKDRIFFFYDYEGTRTISPTSGTFGVPSAAERTGNFSELCGDHGGTFNSTGLCSAVSGQLFDPYSASKGSAVANPYGGALNFNSSAVGSPNGGIRSAFIPFNNLATFASTGAGLPAFITPGVPGNLINPVAAKVINQFPLPNVAGTPGMAGYPLGANFYGTGSNVGNNNQYDIKLDARPTDFDQVSVRFSQVWSKGQGANLFGNVWDANTQGPNTGLVYSSAVNYTHTLSPTTLLTVTAGYDHSWAHTGGIAANYPGFSAASYGFPSNITTSGFVAPPAIVLQNYNAENGNANIGGQPWSGLLYGRDVYHVLASVAKTAGNHDLHMGGEFRIHRINFQQFGTPAGLFNFNQGGTSQYASTGGDSMASFLTGAATGWNTYEVPPAPATQNVQYAGFIQDNWHVSQKLTLNLGVRYDVDLPRTERYNQMSFFDLNASSPLSGQVSPSDCLYCGNLSKGSLEYVGRNGYGRSPYQAYHGAVGPRFGLAYKIRENTTVRGGYGIYYDPSKYGAAGTGSGAAGFLGYDAQSSFAGLDSNNLYPNTILGQPLNISKPSGNNGGVYSSLGGSINGVPIYQFNKLPQEQSWSFGIEHQLPHDILVDAEYVGRKGTHLYLGGDTYALDHLNAATADAFRANPSAFQATVPIPATLLSAVKANTAPFSNGFYGGTWQAYNASLPYPQYPNNVWGSSGFQNIDPPWANSIYNSAQLRVEKRFSHGLQFLATYTFQKSIDNSSLAGSNVYINGSSGASLASVQDPNNLRLERSVSQFDITHIAQFSWVYNLPFGRGQMFGANWNRLVDGVLGGWHLNGIYRWDSGQPLIIGLSGGQSLPLGFNQRPNLPYQLQTSGHVGPSSNYFSNAPAANQTPCSAWIPCPYYDGTAPRVDGQVRAPGSNNLNASLFKDFALWNEASKLEFRAEAFNLLNYTQFGAPVTTVNGGVPFGTINNQANGPRNLQLALKLYF